MGIVVLVGLLGMSRMGVAAHYCAGTYAVISLAAGMLYGAELPAVVIGASIAFVVAYFWFRLLETFEETIFAYFFVAVMGMFALNML